MQHYIKPGVKLIDMCEHLEATVRALVEADGLNAGTLSRNHSAVGTCPLHDIEEMCTE